YRNDFTARGGNHRLDGPFPAVSHRQLYIIGMRENLAKTLLNSRGNLHCAQAFFKRIGGNNYFHGDLIQPRHSTTRRQTAQGRTTAGGRSGGYFKLCCSRKDSPPS